MSLGDTAVRKTLVSNQPSGFIGREQLLKLKRKAMRAGVWFRALPRIDRVLVDLTIKVAQSIRSFSLARSLLSVARKLEGLLESRFSRAVREIGFSLSCRLSLLAQRWGNKDAAAWVGDEDFARYLAVMKLNG
jgi:hypothetical protein